MEISLKGRKIPLNEGGDPAFCCVDLEHAADKKCTCTDDTSVASAKLTVTSVFSYDEIVEIVNRWLYERGYQRDYHKKAQQKLLALNKLLNAKLREMYGHTQAKASPQEIDAAMREIAKEVTNG